MYDECNINSIKDRAFELSIKYLIKANKSNQLIADLIHNYNIAAPLDEGLFFKGKQPRPTVFGILKTHNDSELAKLFTTNEHY